MLSVNDAVAYKNTNFTADELGIGAYCGWSRLFAKYNTDKNKNGYLEWQL